MIGNETKLADRSKLGLGGFPSLNLLHLEKHRHVTVFMALWVLIDGSHSGRCQMVP